GNARTSTKTGMKFEDTNANGVKDVGEPGLSGWNIRAYADNNPANGVLDAAEFGAGPATGGKVNTVAGGGERIGLKPGSYTVCEVLKPNWIHSYPAPNNNKCSAGAGLGTSGYAITLASGQVDSGNDFGNWRQGSKSGTKYNDLNANGTRDAGEPGLPG